MIEQAKAHTGL